MSSIAQLNGENTPAFHPGDYVILTEKDQVMIGNQPLIILAANEKIPMRVIGVRWMILPDRLRNEIGKVGAYEVEVIIHPKMQDKPYYFFDTFLKKAAPDEILKAQKWVAATS